ncbi:DNA phosphorothioation-dependent restriction protein DptG [Escherichia coli]|nr:DNA phosphorothioation-dependent restriction protein DptG [Escherichia coli]
MNELLPFISTKDIKLENFSNSIIGSFTRHASGFSELKLKNDVLFQEDVILNKLLSVIEHDDDTEIALKEFLTYFLYNQDKQIRVFHPFIFNLLSLNESEYNKKLAIFFSHALVNNNTKIKDFFLDKTTDDLFSKLIINNIDLLPNLNVYGDVKYQSILPVLSNLYQEDLLFISKHTDFFIKHFSQLTHFYSFMYINQLVIKFNQFTNADYNSISPVYFCIESEKLNKNRDVVRESNHLLKEQYTYLFSHLHTIYQLSHIHQPTEDEPEYPILTYSDFKVWEYDDELKNSIYDWIKEYQSIFTAAQQVEIKSESIQALIRSLFECIKHGMSMDNIKRYKENAIHIGRNVFTKNGRSLGTVLSLSQEHLLLLIAV